MARKLIGTGVTDENGEATITYTGTGAGQLNIVAESGTFQSETYEVLDTIAYDKGLSGDGNHNDCWQDSNNIIQRQSNGTLLNGNQWNQIILKLNNSTNIPFSNGMCVELDVVAISGNFRIKFNDGSNHQNVWNPSDQQTDIGHWKFTIKDGELKAQFNNETPFKLDDFNTSVSTFQVYLECYVNNPAFKFKNFVIYPI